MKDERICVRTTSLNKEKITRLAKENGMTVSNFILKLVLDYEVDCLYDNIKKGE